MVAQAAKEAKDNARRFTHCQSGLCLMYSRTWLEIPSRDPSAAAAWANANHRHPADRTPPPGAPVFWTGGSQGFGHIGLSMGQGHFRGTDMPGGGQVSTQDIGWVERNWGQNYAGWSEDLNGVLIPYLADPTSQWKSGPVYQPKLHQGQQNSDSVRRLQYRLNKHKEVAHDLPITGNFGSETAQRVATWQRKIAKSGPDDGSEVTLTQARRLFGDRYSVRAHL